MVVLPFFSLSFCISLKDIPGDLTIRYKCYLKRKRTQAYANIMKIALVGFLIKGFGFLRSACNS